MKSRIMVVCALFGGMLGVMMLLWLLPWQAAGARPEDALTVCLTGPPDCQYISIQDAVDAASSGDIIKVAAGRYTGVSTRDGKTQSVYISKTISIVGGYTTAFTGTAHPDVNPTILDAEGQGRVFYISGAIGVILEGLQITGGDATGQGSDSWSHDGAGGGIYVITAGLSMVSCSIFDNIASTNDWGAGGGLYLQNSTSAGVYHTRIFSNVAGSMASAGLAGEGGGVAVYQYAGSVTLVGNTIEGNVASTMGEGIGGGLYLEKGYPTLSGNIVRGNIASAADHGDGGGVYIYSSAPTMVNNVFVDNTSGLIPSSRGSGLAVEDASLNLKHTTIQGNQGGDGSGISAFFGSQVLLENTILVSQTIGAYADAGNQITLTEVLWYANGTNMGGSGTITYTNAITGDPKFFPDGYHIMSGSAAVDAGMDISVSEDVDIQSRPQGSGFDLGADELLVVTTTVDEILGGMLVYSQPHGVTLTLQVPSGAVDQTTVLELIPLPEAHYPIPSGKRSIGYTFDLGAYRNDNLMPDFTFLEPVDVILNYSDCDVAGVKEDELRLYYWNGAAWMDAVYTCSPVITYTRDPVNNNLSVGICHTSRWDYGAPEASRPDGSQLFLPLVMK